MKKLIIILLLILSGISNSQCQTPLHYYDCGWNVLGYQIDQVTGMPGVIDHYQIYFYNDSTINSTYYLKCYYDLNRIFISSGGNILPIDSFHYIGAIRNTGLQYYFLPKDSLNERLIYDMNLTIGDTAPNGFNSYQGKFKVIAGSDTVTLLDNSTRLRYYYTYYDSVGTAVGYGWYIDGIGDLRSIIDRELFMVATYDGGTEIYSYCESGTMLYKKSGLTVPAANTCSFPVSVQEFSGIANGFDLYPNPTKNLVTLKMNNNASNVEIDVFDLRGDLMLSQKCTNQSEIELSLANYPDGMYFIKLTSQTGISVLKVVKQN